MIRFNSESGGFEGHDGTAWAPIGGNGGGSTPDRQVFTSSGTWTKPEGASLVRIRIQAPGGGSGGALGTMTQARLGGGGGGGAACELWLPASSLGASETVTVGAPGVAGDPLTAGGAGGDASFGTHAVCTGGGGGEASGVNAGAGGAGGVATASAAGALLIDGQEGGPGFSGTGITRSDLWLCSRGGDAALGRGAPPVARGVRAAGLTPAGHGGGASGGRNDGGNATHYDGAPGAPGIVIVESYG